MAIYLHKHHVVPKHAGGTNTPSNMSCPLTIEEHAEHHRYRYEMLGEWQDRIAWLGLSGQIGKDDMIAAIHKENGRRMGLWNKGKPKSEQMKKRLSAARKNMPLTSAQKQAYINQIGNKHTEETKQKMRAKGAKSPEMRARISATLTGRKLPPEQVATMRSRICSAETRKKMSEAHRHQTPSDAARASISAKKTEYWKQWRLDNPR